MTAHASPPKLSLPVPLQPAKREIEAALESPIPGNWPEDATYVEADQVLEIAEVLIRFLHRRLSTSKIRYLYKEDLKSQGEVKLGTAMKVGAKLAYLTGLEFLIEINWELYKNLTAEQKIALIDHELCHCEIEDTDDSERPVLRHHDVEEFTCIIQRWGLWKGDILSRRFAEAIRQLDLFPPADAGKE